MRKVLVLFVVIVFMATSCVIVPVRTAGNSGKIPPGQAKKMTGSQSAKPFAPGQRKK